jgi:hypothetical protein
MFSCAFNFLVVNCVFAAWFLDPLSSEFLRKECAVYLAVENTHRMVMDHDSGEKWSSCSL